MPNFTNSHVIVILAIWIAWCHFLQHRLEDGRLEITGQIVAEQSD